MPTFQVGDAPIVLTATSNRGLEVTYSVLYPATSINTNVATISGDTLTIVGTGSAAIYCMSAGTNVYSAATATKTITVSKGDQAIAWNQTPSGTYGDSSITLTATSSKGLAIAYESSNKNVAAISGDTLNFVGLGTATITAKQPGTANYNAAASVAKTIEVQRKQYTLLFDAANGEADRESQPAPYGLAIGNLPTAARVGYNFSGWFTQPNGGGEQYAESTVYLEKQNLTLYAKWSAIPYDITYVLSEGANHADNPATYTVEDNVTLQNPVRTGYTGSWQEGSSIAQGSTGSKTFTAQWTATDYAITYVLRGGVNHADNPATYTIESPTITLQAPTRAGGYTFEHWVEGNTIESGSTGSKTFTAQWEGEAISYIITYVLNGGDNHADNPATYTVDDPTVSLQNPTRTGYAFLGWQEGGSIAAGSTGNRTFTAQWELTDYDISYVLNGGVNHVDNPATYTINSSAIQLQNPIRAGYTFEGWQEGSSIASGSTGNKTFTAQWSVIDYAITYVLNGGAHAGNPDSYTVDSAAISLKNPARTGYSFEGWQEGGIIPQGSTGEKTFTAQWKAIDYPITYVLDGGSNHADNPVTYTVEDNITLQNPVRTGYSGSWQEGSSIASGSTGSKTFTAQWNLDTYAITYHLNGGSNHADNPNTYTINSPAVDLKKPTRAGFTFLNWSNGGSIAQGSTGNKTFTAQWIANTLSAIRTLPVSTSSITENSAVLGGEIQATGTIEHGVVYSSVVSIPTLKTATAKHNQLSSSGAFAIPVTGLSEKTSYYVRTFAVNGSDTVYGETKFFTTCSTNPHYIIEKLNTTSGKPSSVEVLVQVRDRNDDNKGVDNLVAKDFEVWENNTPIASAETHSYIRQMDQMPFEIKTTLVLDVTSSLISGGVNGIEVVKEAAIKLIESKESNQEFSILIFNRTIPEWIQEDFTADKERLINAIRSIDSELPGGITRLYDAYKIGLNALPVNASTADFVRRSFMIVFSDGNDASYGAPNHDQNLNAALNARNEQQVYVLGLGDANPEILGQLGEYHPVSKLEEVEAVFAKVQSEIIREANSLYHLSYLSPKRGDEHTLQLKIKNNKNEGQDAYAQEKFNADNFESVQYGVYVNPYKAIGSITTNAYGLTGADYLFSNGDTLEAVTYWADVLPNYVWETSDSSVVVAEKVDFNKACLRFTGSGSAVIKVVDVNNQNRVQDLNDSTNIIIPQHTNAFQKSFTVNSGGASGTLSARQEAYYTVVFNADGGVPAPDNQRLSNTMVQVPDIVPHKEGYDFAGWYNGNEEWDFYTFVTDNITLKAKWDAQPRLQVSTAKPSSITKDSATLGGSMVSDAAGYTERGVCYALSPEATVADTKVKISGSGINFSARVGKFNADAVYYVRAYAIDEQDTVYGSEVMFSTRSEVEKYHLTGYSVKTEKPYFVEMLVSVKDDNGKGADYLDNKDFVLKQNGISTSESSEFHRYIRKMDAIPFKIKTVLMLDNSASIGKQIANLKQAAAELVKTKNEKQEFAVYAFSDDAAQITGFTDNIDTLIQRISQISMGSSSTGLYDAYTKGMQLLPAEYSTKDSIQKCFLVMLSDGDETRNRYVEYGALENAAINSRGEKTAYMIGLGQNLQRERLTRLASQPSNYFSAANLGEVTEIFTKIQYDIMREANSFYNLVCLTDKRDSDEEVNLELTISSNQNYNADSKYSTSFVSKGKGTGDDDVNQGTYLNVYQNIPGVSIIGAINKYGLGMPDDVTSKILRDTMNVSLPNRFTLQAISYWADVKPQYKWESSDTSVVKVVEAKDQFGQAKLIYTGKSEEAVVITVTDEANYSLAASGKGQGIPASTADFFRRSIRVVKSNIPTYTVAITASTNGIISVKNGADVVTSGATLDSGTVLTLQAMPNTSYTFTKWWDDSIAANREFKLQANANISATFTAVAVTSVDLNKTATTLLVGGTEQLTPTVAPANALNKSVTWSSNNKSVATVSEAGIVTAHVAGTAIITVTTADGDKTSTCKVTVTKESPALSTDATLSNFTVSEGLLSPSFSTSTIEYTVTVANSVSSITLTATKKHSGASIAGDGEKLLEVGANIFNVVITAEDESTQKTYTVTVTRESTTPTLSNDATLSNLTVSEGTLTPFFSASTIEYTVTVANSVASITLTATKKHSGASVSGAGTKPLNVGANIFDITVTAEDESTEKTYKVMVTREAATPTLSNDATLSNLTVNAGTLTPSFSASTTVYAVSVANSVTSITLTATKKHSGASVSGAGVKPLNVGANIFDIVVTAEDSATQKTYTVVVTREAAIPTLSSDATLSNLTVSEGTLSPFFSASTTEYTVAVANSISNITLTATKKHSGASVSGAGVKPLNVGANVFSIVVTAEDGITQKIYKVTVTRTGQSTTVSAAELLPLKLYPTVTNGQLTIDNEQWALEEAVEVYCLSGTLMLTQPTAGEQTSINISQLPSGTYVVRVGRYAGKVVKR